MRHAYFSENVVGRLWQMAKQAVIPIKKRWDGESMKHFYEPFQYLVQWYDDRQADFHNAYRLRPKIEGYFSLVKRVSSGFCWSRGRPRTGADGKLHFGGNADGPCVAWQNETLCKLIYVNLRLIVQYEIATSYRMNFQTDTFFPSIPRMTN